MHSSNLDLSWIFHSRTLNKKINRLCGRCLHITYNDNTSSFTEFLEIKNSVSMHHRNIQVSATELHKFVNGLSAKLVNNCFKLNNMTVYNTEIRPVSLLGQFAKSYMAQNHFPTWDQKFGNLYQIVSICTYIYIYLYIYIST